MTSFNIHTCLKPGEQITEKCFKLLSIIDDTAPMLMEVQSLVRSYVATDKSHGVL